MWWRSSSTWLGTGHPARWSNCFAAIGRRAGARPVYSLPLPLPGLPFSFSLALPLALPLPLSLAGSAAAALERPPVARGVTAETPAGGGEGGVVVWPATESCAAHTVSLTRNSDGSAAATR